MSDESIILSDVLIDLSDLSLDDLPKYGDSSLIRALRRFLAVGDEADVIAEWPNCTLAALASARLFVLMSKVCGRLGPRWGEDRSGRGVTRL
jgi:hypothetical protein